MYKNKFLILVFFSLTSFLSVVAKDSQLFDAVKKSDFFRVEFLVKKGSGLNLLDENGKTVLDIAVETGNKKISRYLLKQGAKVTTKQNAERLKGFLKGRAIGFFIGGFLLSPFMWFGSYFAVSDMVYVEVL